MCLLIPDDETCGDASFRRSLRVLMLAYKHAELDLPPGSLELVLSRVIKETGCLSNEYLVNAR